MTIIIMWLWALLCTNPNHTIQDHGDCNLEHLDIGGETGGGPRPPIPPPPPPPGG